MVQEENNNIIHEDDKNTQNNNGEKESEQMPDTAKKPQKKAKANSNNETQLSALKTENEKLTKELETTKETLLRTAAEYDNFRKRSVREKDSSFSSGLSHSVEKLLPVLDTLILAVNVETTDENFKKGVQLTLDQCYKSFEALGVKQIDALNKEFDPNMHSAVMQQPAEEGVESGTVTQVLQAGYILGDKVIRHASVAVAN